MKPICDTCGRAVPDGVGGLFLDGLTICGPCLWDDYTPQWREHQHHDEPYVTCSQCFPAVVEVPHVG
jgi:hypothetical protein